MVSLTRSLNVAKQQWKIAVWISVIVYVLYWFISKRIQMTRLRFENIHYQVDFLELFDGPVSLKQDDPNLIRFIRQKYLKNPTKKKDVEKFVQGKYSQIRQANIIDEFFYQKRSGFFVEAGAGNGFDKSNTIFLEYERNWRGLLVEPDPILFKDLLESGRRDPKDLLFHACLSTQKYPQKLMIDISGGHSPSEARKLEPVQCLPLTSVLMAATNTEHPVVDFMSLHIQGAELAVLRTIDWSKVDIRALSIESKYSNETAIKELLQSHGFKVEATLQDDAIVFVKSSEPK